MNILTFLCVILSCAAGLDLDASKSIEWQFIFHLLAILIIKMNQNKFPPRAISSLFTYMLWWQIMVAWTNFIFDLLVQMSTRTTKLSFAT